MNTQVGITRYPAPNKIKFTISGIQQHANKEENAIFNEKNQLIENDINLMQIMTLAQVLKPLKLYSVCLRSQREG